MADEPDNLVLELLRAIRADVAALRTGQKEVLCRLGRIEGGQARMRQEMGGDAETVASIQARIDRMAERLDRIERRLDLRDDAG